MDSNHVARKYAFTWKVYMTSSYNDDFLNLYYFYFNDLPEDNKYSLTSDLVKEVKGLHTI